MASLDRLTVFGNGDFEVQVVAAYLFDLTHVYNSILAFDTVVDESNRFGQLGLGWPGIANPWSVAARRIGRRDLRDWLPNEGDLMSLVPISERLVLSAVKLTSPGFWEFLGTLNPLEVTRK